MLVPQDACMVRVSCRPEWRKIPGLSLEESTVLCERADKEVEWVKRCQEVFFKVRQLVVKLRAHTLVYDELSMCCARHQLFGEQQNVNAMRAGLFVYKGMV
jgi:hypothetical protein